MQNVKDAANAIAEKVKGVTSAVSFDLTKGTTKNDNIATGNRNDQNIDGTTNKVDINSQESPRGIGEERGVIGHIGDTLTNAYHFVAEKVQGAASVVSSEVTKDKVKSSNNNAGDKIEDKSH